MRLKLASLTMLSSLAAWACAESNEVPADAAVHDAGAAHDGAPTDGGTLCNLPPEPGPCEAYF